MLKHLIFKLIIIVSGHQLLLKQTALSTSQTRNRLIHVFGFRFCGEHLISVTFHVAFDPWQPTTRIFNRLIILELTHTLANLIPLAFYFLNGVTCRNWKEFTGALTLVFIVSRQGRWHISVSILAQPISFQVDLSVILVVRQII